MTPDDIDRALSAPFLAHETTRDSDNDHSALYRPSADDVITDLVNAPDVHAAAAIVRGLAPSLLAEVADILYVDAAGHSAPWVRAAIVAEARA